MGLQNVDIADILHRNLAQPLYEHDRRFIRETTSRNLFLYFPQQYVWKMLGTFQVLKYQNFQAL